MVEVLVAEDSESWQELLRYACEERGANATIIGNLQDAIAKARERV